MALGLPSTHDVDGLTVADVMHADVTSMPSTVTVGELRAWFAVGASRRLAVLADDGRYAAALTRADLSIDAADDCAALACASERPTISPAAPAATGRDLAIASDVRRVAVVDERGRFCGVLAITHDLAHFACRAPAAPG